MRIIRPLTYIPFTMHVFCRELLIRVLGVYTGDYCPYRYNNECCDKRESIVTKFTTVSGALVSSAPLEIAVDNKVVRERESLD